MATLPHGLLGNRRHRLWQMLMNVARTCRDGLRVDRDLRQVVDVRDLGRVDLAHMAGTTPVGRDIHLARRERKPADGRPCAGVRGSVGGRCADPGHQRRSVDRSRHPLARNPAPGATEERPASVVERCKAPGLVANPAPAPRINPDPAPRAVRCPVSGQRPRKPDGTVFGALIPVAVASRSPTPVISGETSLGSRTLRLTRRTPEGKFVIHRRRQLILGPSGRPELGTLASADVK
jgi:hypothetical protein